jgi:hypothetical protein
MHPEILRVLATARHDDLLGTYPSRGQPRARPPKEHEPLLARSRHRLGLLLVRAGARLMGDRPGALDLAHD